MVERRLAAGGMGEVWVGEHRAIRMRVALKTLLPEACKNAEVVARFKREALFLGRIRSDHFARVLDFTMDATYGPVLVMEYVEGRSVADALRDGPMTVEQGVDLGFDVASALRELHRAQIVHRDVKPGNVILQPIEDGRQRAIVVDFGLSRLVSTGGGAESSVTGITRDDIAVGTMEYMAPEQILRARDVTGSADLYALGALLYRAVAGRHAFNGTSDVELAHAKLTESSPPLETGRSDRVARGFEALVARALERDPAERYECADEMLADLCLLRDAARRARRNAQAATRRDAVLRSSVPPSGISRPRSSGMSLPTVSAPRLARPWIGGRWAMAAAAVAALVSAAALGFGLARTPRPAVLAARAADRAPLMCPMPPPPPPVAEASSAPRSSPKPALAQARPAPAAPPRTVDRHAELLRAMERAVADSDSRSDRAHADGRLSAVDGQPRSRPE